MSADRNDRVVVRLGTTTPEVKTRLRALALARLYKINDHPAVWLLTEVPRQTMVQIKSRA
jgi:hypothetical protein